MDTDQFPQRQTRDATVPEWLLPSVALERFTPPDDLLWSGPEEVAERSRYGFRIGSLSLLIKADVGSEVIRLAAVSTLPGSAPWLLGMMNLRGNLAPLFDLRQVLGLGKADDSPTRLALILDKGENAVGIVIDEFPQPLSALRPVGRLPQLPAGLQGHVHTAYVKEERIWLEFNHESFFDKLTLAGAAPA